MRLEVPSVASCHGETMHFRNGGNQCVVVRCVLWDTELSQRHGCILVEGQYAIGKSGQDRVSEPPA